MCARNSSHKKSQHGMCERNSPNKKLSVLSDCVYIKQTKKQTNKKQTFVGLLRVSFFPFLCVVIFHSVLVQCCCSVLFCLGRWGAPFSILSEPFSIYFFPKVFVLSNCVRTFVGLLCDRVFLFFSFIFCGHFSLSSSSMLSVLFCLGCCRASFSLLSATFFYAFS